MADHHSGYPGVYPWTTSKAWEAYLRYLARRLDRCAESQNILFGQERNEYQEELDEIIKKRLVVTHNDDGSVTHSHTLTPEEEEIRKKYWEREKEICNADQAYIEETYAMLSKNLSRLWD